MAKGMLEMALSCCRRCSANEFVDDLLHEEGLQSLLVKHEQLATDIRSLDSDMQMLVYENYSKFISATDTIRMMKANVEDMESRMAGLLDDISGVEKTAEELNERLSARQADIEKLSGVRSLLRKIQVVLISYSEEGGEIVWKRSRQAHEAARVSRVSNAGYL